MSTASNSPPRFTSPLEAASAATLRLLRGSARLVTTLVRGIAFWLAIVLPMIVFAALVTGVIGTYFGETIALLGASIVCLIVGHDHQPTT